MKAGSEPRILLPEKGRGNQRMAELRIELNGEYDLARKQELSALFDSLAGDDPVVIDITNVTYVDSTALRELSTLRLRNPDRAITLFGPNSNVRRVFALASFDRVFDIRDADPRA
jgi:anti-anti-sigma factor